MRGPRRIQLRVETARIAHNRQPPEAKDHMSADLPVADRVVKKRAYLLLSSSDDARCRDRGARRAA